MSVQTSYNINPVAAYPGLIANNMVGKYAETRFAAAVVNFGTFVVQRASPADGVDQGANPAATADVTARLRGVAVHDETCRNGYGYELNRPMKLLRKGFIW